MPDTDLPRPSATRVILRFRPPEHPASASDSVRNDLSACTRCGDTLFLSCDETAGIERLRRIDDTWGDHRHFPLADFTKLPDGGHEEVDIEGLRIDDDWLWVTGSHALKRGKPDGPDDAKALKKLAKIKRDGNRQFVGRFPLVQTPHGLEPVRKDGDRRMTRVQFTKHGKLRHWLEEDEHLAPFLGIPSKDNGLDVEGIAARGLRVWLGLRGPVLRGFAVILEFHFEETRGGYLKPRRIDGGARYRKHLIDTGGHGVRDLVIDGADMLILTGTPLAGDGAASILRWRDATGCTASSVQMAPAVSPALRLPYRDADDNPEGITAWDDGGWLIVHDSPHPARLDSETEDYLADVWHLTG